VGAEAEPRPEGVVVACTPIQEAAGGLLTNNLIIIIAIVAAVILLIVVIVIVICCCCCGKRRYAKYIMHIKGTVVCDNFFNLIVSRLP
jgi:hypothetical protein